MQLKHVEWKHQRKHSMNCDWIKSQFAERCCVCAKCVRDFVNALATAYHLRKAATHANTYDAMIKYNIFFFEKQTNERESCMSSNTVCVCSCLWMEDDFIANYGFTCKMIYIPTWFFFSACLKYSRSPETVKIYLLNSSVAFFRRGEKLLLSFFRRIFGKWLNRISGGWRVWRGWCLCNAIKEICFCSSLFSIDAKVELNEEADGTAKKNRN